MPDPGAGYYVVARSLSAIIGKHGNPYEGVVTFLYAGDPIPEKYTHWRKWTGPEEDE